MIYIDRIIKLPNNSVSIDKSAETKETMKTNEPVKDSKDTHKSKN